MLPGSCDMVLVRDWIPSSPTVVFVCDFENVPPSWDMAFDWPFRSPEPVSWLLERLEFFVPPAAAPPVASDDPREPSAPVDVPPVPSVVADVPPAAAEPPVPPVELLWANAGAVMSAPAKTHAASWRQILALVLVYRLIMAVFLLLPGRDRHDAVAVAAGRHALSVR